jgi:dTDP-4-dehydrorhamnose reductase
MSQRILVTGASGQLGAYVVHELLGHRLEVVAWSHKSTPTIAGTTTRPVELTDAEKVVSAFRDASPTAVIHTAALAAVADCARDPENADSVNHRASALLASLAADARARLVLVSTDLVFDGKRGDYVEDDPPSPLSVYGRSKVAAEKAVLAFPGHTVVRVSLLFGPSRHGRESFFDSQIASLRKGQPIHVFHDEWRTPLALSAAASALIAIALSDVTGLIHVAGPERLSRLEMGQRLARYLGVNPELVVPVSRTTAAGEPRPRDTSLNIQHWRQIFSQSPHPTFEQALAEMKPSSWNA